MASEAARRLRTGLPLAIGSLIMVALGRIPTVLFLGALSAGAGAEAATLLERRRPGVVTAAVSALALVAGYGLGLWAVPLAVFTWWAVTWQPPSGWSRAIVAGLLLGGGPAALGVLMSTDSWLGWLAVLAVAVFGGESAAWLVGSQVGRHLLAPRVSPHKTWEGAAAQGLFGVATGLVAAIWIPPSEALWLGLAGGIAGQVGDLAQSWCKRRAGVKDSGSVFGAQGGFFDLIDGLLGAALAAAPLLLLA